MARLYAYAVRDLRRHHISPSRPDYTLCDREIAFKTEAEEAMCPHCIRLKGTPYAKESDFYTLQIVKEIADVA